MGSAFGQHSFDGLYRRLNPRQKEAVDALEGPVMVVAGPGTGKTHVLTLRIANILDKTDTDPDSILALTFTEAAAQEMRERLMQIIGSAAYRVTIATFHGFCNSIIQYYPEAFPRIIGSNPITDIDQVRLLRDIVIAHEDLDLLRPTGDPLHHIYAIKSAISALKKENIDPDDLRTRIDEQEAVLEKADDLYHETGAHKGKMKKKYRDQQKEFQKNRELAAVYERYRERLAEEGLYDYDDMIMEVIRALEEDDDLRLSLQEQYHYVLADEHQDANQAQNRLLELLTDFHDRPNLFIVGDEKQAIFRFQGASLENFQYFQDKYPGARLIALEDNYRSSQTLLNAAGSLIVNNLQTDEAEAERLREQADREQRPIGLHTCSTEDVERLVLVNEIEERLNAGYDLSEIAVLYRVNADADAIIEALERAGIPYVLESSQDILADPLVRKLILLLRAVDDFGNDALMLKAAHIDFMELDPLDIHLIGRAARKNDTAAGVIMRDPERLAALDLRDADAVHRFYTRLADWHTAARNTTLLPVFDAVIEESGIMNTILASDRSVERLAKLHGLFDNMRELATTHDNYTLSDFVHYLNILEEHGITVKKRLAMQRQNGVRLVTAHSAKGKEFDVVFLVGATDRHWGNRRNRSYFRMLPLQPATNQTLAEQDNDDDERRLFYVALTRARHEAHILYAHESDDGRERLPTRFIAEIHPDLVEEHDTDAAEEAAAAWSSARWQSSEGEQSASADDGDHDFVRELFGQQGLSVTALNNYLTCPWRYFFMNLVRIPKTPEPHLTYGSAVHTALQSLFDRVADGAEPGKEFLLQRFRQALQEEWLHDIAIADYITRGEEALAGYYDTYHNTWTPTVITELFVSGIELSPTITLKGKLDKLERRDGTSNVNVVDYKTGKPKSKNFIRGETKSSDGGLFRQLVFYKLLLDRDPAHSFNMVSGTIDFVEPNKSGNYKQYSFSITDDDVAELVETIERVAQEIVDGAFWNERCDERDCDFCELREMMK